MARVKNVKDTIYLLIFTEPTYALNISNTIYGQENKRVFLELKQLLKQRWIKESGSTVFECEDKRSQQRIYYQASIRPILDHIEDITQDTVSDPMNEFSIKYTLESIAFRYFIKRNLPEHFTEDPINAIDFILTYFDFLVFISSQNNYIKKFTHNIHEEEDYKEAIKSLQNDKRFITRSPEICKLLFKEQNTTDEITKQLPYLFIFPEKLIHFHPGFSSFGAKYFNLLSKSRDISRLFEEQIRKK